MNIQDIINGCNFQTVADHVIDQGTIFHRRRYGDGDVVYCKTDLTPVLFTELSGFQGELVLITHQSDLAVDDMLFRTRPPCIRKWFAQNATHQHPDLIPIPIGLENHAGPSKGGMVDFGFLQTGDFSPPLCKNVDNIYCNFRLHTHPNRLNIFNFLISSKLGDHAERKTYAEYWKEASRFLFIASPRGNGIDCHRTWEALLMGSVPIVERHSIYDAFDGLPILQIEKWEDLVNPDLLAWHIENHRKGGLFDNPAKLYMPYWREQVANARKLLGGR